MHQGDLHVDEATRLVSALLPVLDEQRLPALLQRVVNLVETQLEGSRAWLEVLDDSGGIREVVTAAPGGLERRDLAADAAETVAPRRRRSDGGLQRPPTRGDQVSCVLPVVVDGEQVARLHVELGSSGRLTAAQAARLDAVVRCAEVAVRHARLNEAALLQQHTLRAVNEVTQGHLAGRPVPELLQLVARHARELVGVGSATISVPSGETLVVQAVDGRTGVGIGDAVTEAAAYAVLRTGLSASLPGELRRGPHGEHCGDGARMHLPLVLEGHGAGVLTVAADPGELSFTAAEQLAVESFAGKAALVLEQAAVSAMRHRYAVLEERDRIARELHDGVIQSLFSVGVNMQALQVQADDSDAVRQGLRHAVALVDATIRELRHYVFGLAPDDPASRDIAMALHRLAADFAPAADDVRLQVDVDPAVTPLVIGQTGELVQLAREALSNAVRHAGAKCIVLRLRDCGTHLLLEVADDGTGFDVQAAHGTGRGLPNLAARAEALGASLSLTSVPGRGTTVAVSLTRPRPVEIA